MFWKLVNTILELVKMLKGYKKQKGLYLYS